MPSFRLVRPLLAVFALSSLTACGNIGPLYLPDDPHPPVYVPPQPAPEPAAAGSMSHPAQDRDASARDR